LTVDEALVLAFERAAGFCECIGGGCPSLTHRPGVNRCASLLGAIEATSYFTVSRFADRTDPENLCAVCSACAESPRRQGQRVPAPGAAGS
jgi:hypothetical protein